MGLVVQKLLSTRADLYVSQGEISGGCATHAAAAALTILGIISKPYLDQRVEGSNPFAPTTLQMKGSRVQLVTPLPFLARSPRSHC